MVSDEKSGAILIGLPLYVTWPFSLVAFNIPSLDPGYTTKFPTNKVDCTFYTEKPSTAATQHTHHFNVQV